MKKILYAICFISILFLSYCDCIEEGDKGCREDSDCCQTSFFGNSCEPIYVEAWTNCRGCEGTKESCDGTAKEWCRISGKDGICQQFQME